MLLLKIYITEDDYRTGHLLATIEREFPAISFELHCNGLGIGLHCYNVFPPGDLLVEPHAKMIRAAKEQGWYTPNDHTGPTEGMVTYCPDCRKHRGL